MSKYTLSIYEWSVGTIGTEFSTLDNVKQVARSLVFNKDFSFYSNDTNIKNEFINKFINKYLFEEMGLETPALWRDRLYTRLQLIMPKYTDLFKSKINNVNDLKSFTEDSTTRNKTHSDKKDDSTQRSSSNSSTTDIASSSSSDENGTQAGVNNSDTNSQNLRSDEPQSTITDNAYASLLERGETKVSENNSNSTTLNSETSGSSKNTTSESGTESVLFGSDASGNENEIVMKQVDYGNKNEMYKSFRELIFNIDEMILNDLEDLFMLVF